MKNDISVEMIKTYYENRLHKRRRFFEVKVPNCRRVCKVKQSKPPGGAQGIGTSP